MRSLVDVPIHPGACWCHVLYRWSCWCLVLSGLVDVWSCARMPVRSATPYINKKVSCEGLWAVKPQARLANLPPAPRC